MARPRAPQASPGALRDRAHKDRRKRGLVVVRVEVHETRVAEIEAAAGLMREPRDAKPKADERHALAAAAAKGA